MKPLLLLTILAILISTSAGAEPPVEQGKAIFSTRCATCHNINKRVVGPALSGIDERRSMDWIVKFVQSSQSLIKSGDEQAAAVFAEFNSIPMPDHSDLSADDIKNIVAYIKSESSTAAATTAPFARPAKLRPAYIPVRSDNYLFFGGLMVGILMLIFSLLLFVRVKELARANEA